MCHTFYLFQSACTSFILFGLHNIPMSYFNVVIENLTLEPDDLG